MMKWENWKMKMKRKMGRGMNVTKTVHGSPLADRSVAVEKLYQAYVEKGEGRNRNVSKAPATRCLFAFGPNPS